AVAKMYWISAACDAPYGKLTGGRKFCGAFVSLNSYAKVRTNSDASSSANRAVQANIASVPKAPTAWSKVAKLVPGYCAWTSATAGLAAGTAIVAAIAVG